MFDIGIDPYVNRIIQVYHLVFVFSTDEATVIQKFVRKVLFVMFMFCFPVTTFIGALQNENKIEALYLATLGVCTTVFSIKAYYAYSKENDIIHFLSKMCTHSIPEETFFLQMKKTLKIFRNFAIGILLLGTISMLSLMIICIYENTLPIKIWFPLNWKENNIYFWIAYCYVLLNSFMAIAIMQFTTFTGSIMLNCAFKYKLLGHRFRQLGNLSNAENHSKLADTQDLVRCIQVHQEILLNTKEFRSSFSSLFFGQITTGGCSICFSVFLLSFGWSGNIFKYVSYVVLMLYLFFDIFVIMYLGNEIQIASDELEYCIFESNWINKSNSYKKNIIIAMNAVKQPHILLIAKLYPLDLNTFMMVLKGAYSMFNLLQNV